MAIKLFEHNRQAYEAVVTMLAETSKAAVIHSTGTGKSYMRNTVIYKFHRIWFGKAV